MARVVLVGPPGSGKSTVGSAVAGCWACRCTTRTPPSRPRRAARSPTSSSRTANPRSVTWSGRRWRGRWPRSRACSRSAGVRRSTRSPSSCSWGRRSSSSTWASPTPSKRVGFDQSRPLLAVNPRASWVRLMNERRPVYERVATHRVDTAGRIPGGRRRGGRRAAGGAVSDAVRPSSASARRTTSSWATACPTGWSGCSPAGWSRSSSSTRRRCDTLRAPGGRRARGAGLTVHRGARPRRGAGQGRRRGAAAVGGHGRAGLHPLGCRGGGRGGHRHRPGGVRRGDVAARGGGGPRADDAARDGRRGGRGQDRHQHRGGQEPRRGLPRAGGGAVRPRHPAVAAPGRPRRRAGRGRQGRLHRGPAHPRARRGGPRGRDPVGRARTPASSSSGRSPSRPRSWRRTSPSRGCARSSTTGTPSATRSSTSRAYRRRHGEAVAIGMTYAAELGPRSGHLGADVVARHRSVLSAVGLPTTLPRGSVGRPARGDAPRQEVPGGAAAVRRARGRRAARRGSRGPTRPAARGLRRHLRPERLTS